ncbi:MAG: aspartate aminotransferase family protein [Planctomycetota bacterium]|jgi:predicted acetylornithine/succinylornithine family transaminase|nr:MAG: aspartate aminotransferase family protein [Planctomycetota bacterium]
MKSETVERYQKYVIPNYTRYPVCLVKGAGSRVWDDSGKPYLDYFPGWGCALLGHCPPLVVDAVQQQVAKLIHVPNSWHTEPQGELAEALCNKLHWPAQAFFCNSGTEANEAAIKIARLWGKPNGKFKIITMIDSFHGRTMGSISATGQPKYQQNLEPLLPGFVHVPFGDIDAVAAAIDHETAAVLIEPIQGEGGINIPPAGYMQNLRQLTRDKGMLLMLDEVQSGMGRVGEWYAHQLDAVEADVVSLAKALASGIAMGGVLARPEVAAVLKPGTHAATYGGNPISAVASLATIRTIEKEGLLARSKNLEELFRKRFTALMPKCPWITEVRARGVMVGIQLSIEGAPIVKACLEKGLLINCTHQTVIRLLPAMNLSDAEFEEGCSILEEALINPVVS